ncbi:MAG: hypothetical protein F9K48_04560 [Candidatus Brocadia sp.]|nr:MAG: hypothetical protein F9K48_04560 [Candidatus Brocadia sp.]
MGFFKKLNCYSYLIFGIENNTHKIIGTDFKPTQHKKGNEEILHWLAQRLNPRVDFVVHEFEAEGKQVAIFEIEATRNQPVDFMHKAYIRVGSITRLLREFPEKERKIWNRQPPSIFEKEIALSGLSADEVIALIDTQSVFELLKLPCQPIVKVFWKNFIPKNSLSITSGLPLQISVQFCLQKISVIFLCYQEKPHGSWFTKAKTKLIH